MAKRYFPLLPKMKENSAVNPDKASVWENEPHDFLNQLVKSLAVSGTIKDIGHIDSIPDVWARPMLFEMALFDEQGSSSSEFVAGLHERVQGEWRALLAMLALKEIRHLNLRAEAVHLDNEDAGLAQVLDALAPTGSIDPETTGWKDIYVLFYDDTPIGMTSPATLVSAAADYMTAFQGCLTQPWSADGVTLVDPIPMLMPDELSALYTWLKKLYESLRERQISGKDENMAFQGILRCLDEYMRTIQQRERNAGNDGFSLMDADLSMNIGIFRFLNRTVKGKKATANDSAVRLILSKDRQKEQDVLLVSPRMVREYADNLGLPAPQLPVWPGISANDVTEDSLAGENNQIAGVTLGNAVRYRPEDFFTDRMTVMEPGKAFPASLEIEGMEVLANEELTPILPITSTLLNLFTPEEIASRLTLENHPDRITVRFRFPLSGTNGIQEDYRYTRDYPKEELIFLDTNVPVVEIWPNFRREGWKKYYLYYENSMDRNTEELGRNFFYVDPWSYGQESIAIDSPEHGLANHYTAQMNGFPDALSCMVLPSQDGSYAQPVEAGFVLLKMPPVQNCEPELQWQVGIDFGTSSTMLYYREGRHGAQPLALKPNLFQVTDSKVARNRTFVDFIPSEEVDHDDGSFLSIFHILDASRLHDEIRPLQDGHVFWLTTDRSKDFANVEQHIDANLKWKGDATGRRKVAAYIKQICLQSMAEAALRGVEKIHWNFSFPTAFSEEQKFAFEQACREAIDEGCQSTCFSADDAIEPWPESKASAYHFNKLGGSDTNFSEGAICLDIGAGTTDISIISGQPGRIVYHTSIQFAGRYVFRPIYRHYEDFVKIMPDFAGTRGEKRQAILDADMREHSEEYLKNLKNVTGKESIRQVLQESQFAVAGIFYYLGDLLRKLTDKGIYKESHVPDIFVGGNGSRIFSWISGGTFTSDSPFLQVFKDMLVEASGLDKDSYFKIYLSDQPKIEVAAGMIEEKPHNDAEFFNESQQEKDLFGKTVDSYVANSVFAGEPYELEGKGKDQDTFISAYDIAKGISVKKMPQLEHFVEIFNQDNHIWSDGIETSESQQRDILKKVNSYYVAEKGKDVKKIFVEPIFIMGLKKMVEVLGHEN